eukprot:m51a1_g3384 hypothetical protein (394) ;mRNA; f:498939-500312
MCTSEPEERPVSLLAAKLLQYSLLSYAAFLFSFPLAQLRRVPAFKAAELWALSVLRWAPVRLADAFAARTLGAAECAAAAADSLAARALDVALRCAEALLPSFALARASAAAMAAVDALLPRADNATTPTVSPKPADNANAADASPDAAPKSARALDVVCGHVPALGAARRRVAGKWPHEVVRDAMREVMWSLLTWPLAPLFLFLRFARSRADDHPRPDPFALSPGTSSLPTPVPKRPARSKRLAALGELRAAAQSTGDPVSFLQGLMLSLAKRVVARARSGADADDVEVERACVVMAADALGIADSLEVPPARDAASHEFSKTLGAALKKAFSDVYGAKDGAEARELAPATNASALMDEDLVGAVSSACVRSLAEYRLSLGSPAVPGRSGHH